MTTERPSYRGHLQTTVATSAAPYGYTLTIWTSGAVTTHARGVPDTWEALLFLVGAVVGFGIAAAIAYGHVARHMSSHGAAVRLWGGFHFASVGLSIAAVAIVTALVDTPVDWLLVSLLATLIYLLTVAAQFTLADARRGLP